MKIKEIIGYQIESSDDTHEIPDMFYSFQVFSEQDVDKWLALYNYKLDGEMAWKKVPVFDGDIENPMFSKIG